MAGNADSGEDWSDKVGSVLIARSDKKPSEMSYLHVILGLLNETTYTASTSSVEEAMRMLTPTSFKEYYPSAAAYFKSQNSDQEWSDRTPWEEEQVAQADDDDDEEL